MTQSLFIDGAAGTTGLQIRERLEGRSEFNLLTLSDAERKNPARRAEALNSADFVILCLPDDAARDAIKLIENPHTRVIDASSAHRVAEGWTYGLAELDPGQQEAIAAARFVSNPGCWPSGFLALVRPLVRVGIIPSSWPLIYSGASGYSGGGKAMIAEFEGGTAPAFELYGLGLEHKHIPELQAYSKLARRPIFVPSVGNFYKGMLVSVPLHLDTLPGKPTAADLHAILAGYFADSELVSVVPMADDTNGRLEPEALNDTDRMELRVFGNDTHRQAVLVARLDNLGKGASGAAVQNLKLMLGL